MNRRCLAVVSFLTPSVSLPLYLSNEDIYQFDSFITQRKVPPPMSGYLVQMKEKETCLLRGTSKKNPFVLMRMRERDV